MGLVTLTFLILLCLKSTPCFCKGIPRFTCIQSERRALLKFKQDLKDSSNMLADWKTSNANCCNWVGVVCHNVTGHVSDLKLGRSTAEAHRKFKLGGSISNFLCYRKNQKMKLEVLDLSDNLFSGEIPDCWETWPSVVAIEFCNNNFSGKIPSSMGALTSLQFLHLRSNNLVGEVPSSLGNCTELLTLDLGANRLFGEIPPWMGERLSKLIIISLPTNMFHGPIPEKFFALSSLQILDLSHNNLSGDIPSCINNLTAMISRNKSDGKISYNTSRGFLFDNMALVMKGVVFDYSTTLRLIKLVDLSYNNLSGGIPEEVTSLIGLISLNLSNNHLVGRIPYKIGDMKLLECVDLSKNNLSGKIPNSMSQLSFLSYLNLSYNKLSGEIPLGTQLQSFDASSFLGNDLHGPPLTPRNSKLVTPSLSNIVPQEVDNGPHVDWLCMEFGFLFGFVCVAGLMLFTNSKDSCIARILNTMKMNFCCIFEYNVM